MIPSYKKHYNSILPKIKLIKKRWKNLDNLIKFHI